jgi:hypothetical protein
MTEEEKKNKKTWRENGKIFRDNTKPFWDQDDTERYYVQDYIGRAVKIYLMSSETPIVGELIEMGKFVYVLRSKSETLIVRKQAIEIVCLAE